MKPNQIGIRLLELSHRRLRGADIKLSRDLSRVLNHDKTVQPIGEIDLEATSQLE